jgi:hypothetical protein
MQQPPDPATQDQRRDLRVPIDDYVTVAIDAQNLVGPGRNVSAQGVYFTTTGSVRVHVRIAGSPRAIPGELVRVDAMGDGNIGIAVRFLPSAADDERA